LWIEITREKLQIRRTLERDLGEGERGAASLELICFLDGEL
jgi:hypothetical protein